MSRFVDRGAVFAGWVGVGVALVIAIAFELIIAVQTLVFLVAPVAGMLVGAYANNRSERRRPVWRVLSNAAYAGAVTGVALALMYASLRLLFVYADSGFRVPSQGGQLECRPGPACTYARYVADGRGADLATVGVVDPASFERYVLGEHAMGAVTLVVLTLAGSVVAGGFRVLAGPGPTSPTSTRDRGPTETASRV